MSSLLLMGKELSPRCGVVMADLNEVNEACRRPMEKWERKEPLIDSFNRGFSSELEEYSERFLRGRVIYILLAQPVMYCTELNAPQYKSNGRRPGIIAVQVQLWLRRKRLQRGESLSLERFEGKYVGCLQGWRRSKYFYSSWLMSDLIANMLRCVFSKGV
jgi:hypothetical protein